jgi:hypothetical protein
MRVQLIVNSSGSPIYFLVTLSAKHWEWQVIQIDGLMTEAKEIQLHLDNFNRYIIPLSCLSYPITTIIKQVTQKEIL